MIKIRLRREGAKKRPFYRIVVADSRSPRDGRFIEIIGTYNPLTEPAEIRINRERAIYWLGTGAQPTDTVSGLLRRVSIIDGSGRPPVSHRTTRLEPLAEGYRKLLWRVAPSLRRQPDKLDEFAVRLTEYTKEWGQTVQEHPEHLPELKGEMEKWITEFVQRRPSPRKSRSGESPVDLAAPAEMESATVEYGGGRHFS